MPRRVLIVLPNWVGDVVLASPALAALRAHFRSAHIAYLGRPYIADVVANSGWFDEMIAASDKSAEPLFSLAASLRRDRFDLAILFPNSFRSALAVWMGRARRRVGYDRDGRGWMLTDRLQPRRNGRDFIPVSMLDYYNAIAAAVGCREISRRLSLHVGPADEPALRSRLPQLDTARPLVVLNPGGAYGTAKIWPADRFAAVGDELYRRFGAQIVATGTANERPIAEALRAAAREPIHLCFDPPLGLGPLKSLIRRADLLVTNDTGPRHYAIAFDVPVVTVFGPTDPAWTETSFEHERKVMLALDCQPCQEKICPLGHTNCMQQLGVDRVLASAVELVSKRLAHRSPSLGGVGT